MRATVSSVTCGAKAAAYCERSVRPAIISVNQRIAHAGRASPVGDAAGGAVSARAIATGSAASRAIRSASAMRLNRSTARWTGFADRVNMLDTFLVEGRAAEAAPIWPWTSVSPAAFDRPQRPVLDLLPQERDRIARILEVRDQVGRGAADEPPD